MDISRLSAKKMSPYRFVRGRPSIFSFKIKVTDDKKKSLTCSKFEESVVAINGS